MLQQAELKQISQQIFPVIKEEIAKIAVTEIKKTLLTTDFQKTNGGYSQSLDSQLIHHIDKIREDMNTRFAEQREYSDKINADQKENSDKINAEQGKRIELLISQIDKRNAEQREDSDKRNAEQREDINTRFAEQREYSDKRFEDMNKRFTHFQWLITGGFGLVIILMTLYKFFLQTPTL